MPGRNGCWRGKYASLWACPDVYRYSASRWLVVSGTKSKKTKICHLILIQICHTNYLYNLVFSPSGTIWIKDLLCNQNQYFKGCSLDLVLIKHLQDLDTDLRQDLQKGAFCILCHRQKASQNPLSVFVRACLMPWSLTKLHVTFQINQHFWQMCLWATSFRSMFQSPKAQ